MLVSPSRRRMVEFTVRLLNVGRPWKPAAPTAEISSLSSSETSPSWCARGVMSMLTPTFLYSKDVMGCWAMPPLAIAVNVVTGTGTWSPNRAWAVSPSETLSWGLARSRVEVSVSSRRTTAPGSDVTTRLSLS